MTISKDEAQELENEIARVEAALLALKERVARLSIPPKVEAWVGGTYKNDTGTGRVLVKVGTRYHLIADNGNAVVYTDCSEGFTSLGQVQKYMIEHNYTADSLK